MKKIVLVFGTFDFLHIGHISFLHHAKKNGDLLVVAVARDSVVKEIKKTAPIHNEKERKAIISELACVDQTMFGDRKLGQYTVLKKVHPNVVAVGYDQREFEDDLRRYIKAHRLNIIVVRIPAYKPKTKKSSMIKKALSI